MLAIHVMSDLDSILKQNCDFILISVCTSINTDFGKLGLELIER